MTYEEVKQRCELLMQIYPEKTAEQYDAERDEQLRKLEEAYNKAKERLNEYRKE